MKQNTAAHSRLARHAHLTFKTLHALPRRQVIIITLCLLVGLSMYFLSESTATMDLSPFGGNMLTYRAALHKQYSHVLVTDCPARLPDRGGKTVETRVRGVDLKYISWAANEWKLHANLRAYPPVRVMSKFRRPATLLDVGANVGKIAFPALALPGPHTVVAVEPVRANMHALCMTASLNGWLSHPGLTLVQAALSDADGTMEIFVPEGREDNSALSASAPTANVHVAQHPETIHTVTGDALLRAGGFAPDVTKIDTQGHEIHVLRGLRRYLRRAQNVLVIAESDPKLMKESGVDPKDVYKLMVKELGYTAFSTADVSVANDVLHVSGDVITEEVYPTRTAGDIFYFKTS